MQFETIAAVDLGSNSFRLQVGRVLDEQVYPLDSLKEPVRLASGLQADKTLDAESRTRALEALSRFGERLRGFEPGSVRAVATNTLRVAKDANWFLPEAEAALGFPIEIIAGREEARLIYLGAAHSLPAAEHKRLVVDIGGGSTEFIIGTRFDSHLLESLYMGCVSYTLRFFGDGTVDKKRFREAEVAAAREIELIAHDYKRFGWHESIGSSGTARAIADLLEVNQLNPGNAPGITRAGLERLKGLLIKAGSAAAMPLEGLRNDRTPVLPGGLAIMCSVFSGLGIESMNYADGALRLGVLYDLVGRFHHHDMRDATVSQFQRRYQVDRAQAERVERTALALFDTLAGGDAGQEAHPDAESGRQFLSWAARLHEVGISIAHNGYHKHGAYILTFADMPGFSKKDQARLAMLVLGHRGKLQKVATLPPQDINWILLFALRFAVLLHRSHNNHALPPLAVRQDGGRERFHVDLPAAWLGANPLTAGALSEEVAIWRGVGQELRVSRVKDVPQAVSFSV